MAPTSAPADGQTAILVTAFARDGHGNPVPGTTVNFSASGTGNVLNPPSATTNANGEASSQLTSTSAEQKTVTAGIGTTRLNAVVTFTPVPDPARSTFTASAASATANGVATIVFTATFHDANDNPLTNAPVTFTSTGTTNVFSAVDASTDASGVAHATLASARAEAKTVSVTCLGKTLSQSVDFVPGPADAAHSSLIASAPSATADGVATITFTATFQDVNANPIANAAVGFTSTGSGNVLSAVDAVTDASGVAHLTLASTHAEVKTVSATGAGTTLSQSVDFVAGAVDVAHSSLTASTASATANGVDTITFTAAFRDAHDNPIANAGVGFTATGSGNVLSAVDAATDGSGVAHATLASTRAETKTVGAVCSGATLSQSVELVPGSADAAHSSFAVSATQTFVGQPVDTTFTLRDAQDNAISGLPVTFAASGSANTWSVNGVATAADGTARSAFSSTQAEAKDLWATAGGVTLHQQVTVASVATHLAFSVQPKKTLAGAVLAPVVVQAQDGLGNVDPTFQGSVTVSLAPPATSTLSGTLTAQVVNGSATFDTLKITPSGTGLQLTATVPGLTAATSAAFDAPAWMSMDVGLPPAHVGEMTFSSDGATAYATAGRLFRSDDQGVTWKPVLEIGDAQRVATDPFNPGTVIVVSQSNLWMSSDRGEHWTSIKGRLPGWQGPSTVAFDPQVAGVIYVGRYNGLPAKSTDGGATFTTVAGTGLPPLSPSDYPDDITVDGNSRIYMMMLYEGPYRSDDGGATWTPISSGLAKNANGTFQCGTPQRMIADRSQPGSVYFTFATWGNPCASPAWHSADYGATWSPTAATGNSAVLAVNPSNHVLYAATPNGLFRSVDEGATVTSLATGSWDALALDLPTGELVGVSDQVLRLSQDDGATWSTGSGISGPDISRVAVGAGSPASVYAIAYYTGLFVSQGGGNWTESFANVSTLGVDPSTAGYAYLYTDAQGQEGLYGTADAGQSWSWLEHNISSFACWMDLAVDPRDPATLWGGGQDCFGSTNGGLWRSTDQGITWAQVVNDPSSQYSVRSVAIDGTDSSTLYIVSSYGVRRVVLPPAGGTATLTDLSPGLSGTANAVSTDPTQHGVVFASTSSGVFKSTDSGATWTEVLARSTQYPVRISPSQPQTAYALTGSGTYKTQDGGATWTFLALPAGVFASDLAIAPSNPDELYLASGSGVWASLSGGR